MAPFVGRTRELAMLADALADASAGRGGAWLVEGEAGAGKTRVVEETEREAAAQGFACVWGRCWESGGAPAYWPWAQAFGALARTQPAAAATKRWGTKLATLVPTWSEGRGESPPADPGSADRFALFAAAAAWLTEVAEQQPVCLVLEDLHWADPSSVALWSALTAPLRSARVVLMGTRRTASASSDATAALTRHARAIALGRLSEAESRSLLAHGVSSPEADVLELAVAAAEGHPLFVVELARLLDGAASGGDARERVPATVQALLARRLHEVDAATRRILAEAAVIGRDIDEGMLHHALGHGGVTAAMRQAQAVGLVTPVMPGQWRLSHALLGQALLEDPDEAPDDARRRAIHADVGQFVAARPDGQPAVAAHHFSRAGADYRAQAVEALLEAAERAVEAYAFEDAEAHLQDAGARLDSADHGWRARVAILRGLTRIGLGATQTGLETIASAAEHARRAQAPELLAEAALAYGSILRIARVDANLVGLLEDALAAMPQGDSKLRARLLARLAGAQQPAERPQEPISMALEAFAMAERIGDPQTEIPVLRNGCSALVDLAHPRERIRLDERHCTLAERFGLATDALQARTRLLMDAFELGDVATARGHRDAARALAESDAHPRYRWRAPALDALTALWEGRLSDAQALIDASEQRWRPSGNHNGRMAAVMQRVRLWELTGQTHDPTALAEALQSMMGEAEAQWASGRLAYARLLLLLGRGEEVDDLVTSELASRVFAIGDRTMFEHVARFAAHRRDAALGARLLEHLAEDEGSFSTDGVLGLVWRSPTSLTQAVGETRRAHRWAVAAAERAEAAGGMPIAAEAHLHAARWADDQATAQRHREAARATIDGLGLEGLRWALDAPRPPARVPPLGEARGPRFTREGEVWRVEFSDTTVRLKSTKGLEAIAYLVARPGQDVHVLDLVAQSDGHGPVDRGDGGAVLDAQARAELRARAAELAEALAQAERDHDLGRAQALLHERERIAEALSAGTSLDGRARRSPGAEERARQAIRKRIETALRRAREADAGLGRHLTRSIATGRLCRYDP